MTEFNQPVLDNGAQTGSVNTEQAIAEFNAMQGQNVESLNVGDNESDDPLSVAARTPATVAVPVEKAKPTPYKLQYAMHGKLFTELHQTIPHALASLRRLRQLGINAVTSTDSREYRAAGQE